MGETREELEERLMAEELSASHASAAAERWEAKADDQRARAERAEAELKDYRLLVGSEVARLSLLLEDIRKPPSYTGRQAMLESVIENLSAPAPGQEDREDG